MDVKLLVRGAIPAATFFVILIASSAQAVTVGFDCITNTNNANCAIAEAQMTVDITDAGSSQVLFEFSNNDVGAGTDITSIIGEVYFYDGLYLNVSPSIINGVGVNFQSDKVKPDSLPGYSGTPLSVFASTDVAKNTADGVAVGDGTLGILFDLLPGADFNSVLGALGSGELVVGIHAKSLGLDDGSESLINTPVVVPVPAAVWLFGSGLFGLVGIARRRKQ